MSRWAPRSASRQLALQVLYAVDLARGARPGSSMPPVPVADEVFEEVARELLRADRVSLNPGYKGQCVYPEHAR